MQYILTEQELNRGCELLESWKEENIPIGEVYNKSESLNERGYYTLIECTNFDKELYEIRVFQKNR